MERVISKAWRALEALPGLAAVSAEWRELAGTEYEGLLAGLLQKTARTAGSYPCPQECGCRHRVVRHDDGRIVGICDCESWNCEDLVFSETDLEVYELSWTKLGRGIARAFGCECKLAELGVRGTRQVAAFSGAGLPLVVTLQYDDGSFRRAVAELVAGLRQPFILLAPTGRFVDARCLELLANVQAGFFDLESHVLISRQGVLQPRRGGAELFARFLPAEPEEVPEEVARRAFKLVEQLDSDQVVKPPSVLTVFRLYCLEELTAEEIATKWNCSKGTVINRLKFIREATGMEPEALRRLSSQFEKIEEDVRRSQAAYIHRKGLIDESGEVEDGE